MPNLEVTREIKEEDLKGKNYFKDKSYMSYSEFKKFQECEAKAMAEIRGDYVEPPNKSYLMGGYVDAHFSGEEKIFADKHPEIYGRNGLKSDFVQCDEIIKSIEGDDYFHSFYQGKAQVIETGIIAGVPFKGKFDFLTDDRIVDMKLMRNVDDIWVEGVGKVPFWKAYGYDIQASIYQYLHLQNSGKRLPFYLVVATKEDITGKYIFKFSQKTLDSAMAEVKQNAPRYQSIKEGTIEPVECGHCDWFRQSHKMDDKDIKEI